MSLDLLAECAVSLAASSSTEGQVAAFYTAAARVSLEQARARLRELDLLVAERERVLVAEHRPRQQLGFEEGADNGK